MTRWVISGTASSAAPRSRRAASTPGSAPPGAGPHGIASTSATRRPGRARCVWSITAMSDATDRLLRVRAWNRPRAFAVISEAVWWVTIVDATLVRHHPDAYDAVMTGQAPAQRQLIEETLAGLRFGTGSATKPILVSSSNPATPVRAQASGVSRAGHGNHCRNRRSGHFRHALRRGKYNTLPGLPGSAPRPHHRGDLRPGRQVPEPGRREHTRHHRQQHPGQTLKTLSHRPENCLAAPPVSCPLQNLGGGAQPWINRWALHQRPSRFKPPRTTVTGT